MTNKLTAALERLPDCADVTRDEVIAYLAHLDGTPAADLIEARERGAQIGTVGSGAHLLRARIKANLTAPNPHA